MAFRFEKLTVKAQEAVQRAQEIAEQKGNQQLVPLHLLKALLEEEQGVYEVVLEVAVAPTKTVQTVLENTKQVV